MIFATPNRVPATELEKVRLLLALLKEKKLVYEFLADRITDKWMQRTVLNLAQDCNQYAHELRGQLETMSGRPGLYRELSGAPELAMLPEEENVLQSCQISEKQLIVAYRNIVNTSVLDVNLRSLLHNQLNGIICAFMQVKLLSASFR